MMKIARTMILVAWVVLCVTASAALAEAVPTEQAKVAADSGRALAVAGACFGAALAVIGGALGIGKIGAATVESIARQPEASGSVFTPMIIAAAMIEGGMLFAIAVCWILGM